MSDLQQIAEKLAQISDDSESYEHGARIISQGGMPSGMSALIRAIEDTVLERKLEIMTGTHLISLIASGRRLRGISQVVPAKGNSAKLVGKPLSRDDENTLDSVFALLSELVGSSVRLSLRSLPPEPFGKAGEYGVQATELAEIWQVDMDEEPLPAVERFLRINESAFAAYLHANGSEVVSQDGDIGALQTIWDSQVEDFLAQRENLPGHADGPQLLTLNGALGEGQAVALGLTDDALILMIHEAEAAPSLHASWQAIFS